MKSQKKVESAIVICTDMKKNTGALKSIVRRYAGIRILLLIDRTIIQLVSEIFREKGWMGYKPAEELQDTLLKHYEIMADRWKDDAQAFLKKEDTAFSIQKHTGNLKDSLIHEIKAFAPNEIALTYTKGFNPYLEVIKPVCRELGKKYKLPVREI